MTTPEPRPRKEMAKRLREATAAGQCIVLQDREALKVADWLEADEKPLLQIEEAIEIVKAMKLVREWKPTAYGQTAHMVKYHQKTLDAVIIALQTATSKTTG